MSAAARAACQRQRRRGGFIPDLPHQRTQRDAGRLLVRLQAPSSLVGKTSWVAKEADLVNQGESSGCFGHGSAQIIYTAYGAAGTPLLWTPSPRRIYRDTRAIARKPNADGSLPPLTDDGASPSDGEAALQKYGIMPMTPTVTPDGRRSDTWTPADVSGIAQAPPANVNDEPTADDLQSESKTIIQGMHRVEELDPAFPKQMGLLLDQGAILGVGAFVDTAFENWNPANGAENAVDLTDPNGGGHWLAITYYYTAPDGTLVFGGPNSWGRDWPSPSLESVPNSPFWTPGHYEVGENWLRAASSDIYTYSAKPEAEST